MDYSRIYYKMSRPDLASKIKPGPNRILEVGCAEGYLGESLRQGGLASEVIGIEVVPEIARSAMSRLDRVICGDIETMDEKVDGLERCSFDYVVCGDVLEHLRDPWTALRRLVTLVKPNGHIVVSVPNIRHWSVVLPLLFMGRWEYQPRGILDRTHLRFFTRTTAIAMIQSSGLDLVICEGASRRGKKDRLAAAVMLGMGKAFTSRQWILVGTPCRGRCG